MSGSKWEPRPRMNPAYLARWEQLRGYWRLVVTDRWWDVIDSAFTDIPVTENHPDDRWLGKLDFIPLAGTTWDEDGVAWERAVVPAHPRGQLV